MTKRVAAITSAYKRAIARRSKQATEHVSSVITFRVTPQERMMLDMVALRQGESLSAFVRASALDVAQAMIESEGGVAEFVRRYGKDQNEQTAEMIDTMVKSFTEVE